MLYFFAAVGIVALMIFIVKLVSSTDKNPPAPPPSRTLHKGDTLVDVLNAKYAQEYKERTAARAQTARQYARAVQSTKLGLDSVLRISYNRLMQIARTSSFSAQMKKEGLPYLVNTILFAAVDAGIDTDSEMVDLTRAIFSLSNDHAFIDQRHQLYLAAASGEMNIRREWFLGNNDVSSLNPIMKMFFLYGDLVVNEECGYNYESAPLVLWGMDVLLDFTEVMGRVNREVVQPILSSITSMI